MIMWILHFFRGYIFVKFEGVYSEKILSRLAEEGIGVWKLQYKSGTIYAKMYAKDFIKLKSIKRGMKIKIGIVGKYGFPFFVRRYRHRSGLIVGAVIFFIMLKFLSGFIWIINVDGNSAVKTKEIVNSLKEAGIYETMPRANIDAKISAQELLLRRNDLAWASLNVEGCVLNVNVTEIKNTVKRDTETPANLVASCDGVVRKIDAVSGDVRVKVGDNVHKGDVLISGIIENMSSTVFVHAGGTVIAQIEKTFKSREDFMQRIKVYTGRKSSNSVLEILGLKIPLFLARKQAFADISYKSLQMKILGKRVPVRQYRACLKHYTESKLFFSEDELKTQLSKRLKDYLETESIDGYIPVGTEYKTDNDGVQIIHRYLCDGNIAVENKILVAQ